MDHSLLSQFEVLNAKASVLLSFADTSMVEPKTSANGQKTLFDTRFDEYIHCPEDPLQEAKEWAEPIINASPEFLVIFGLGLGWHWRALRPWLQKKRSRRLIIVEDDIATISHFLHSEYAHELFDDPQSTLLYIDDDEKKQVFQILAWNAYKKRSACVASPAYKRYRADLFEQFFNKLTTLQIDVSSVVDEFMTFGEGQLHNFGRNLFLWDHSKNAASLFEEFKGVPAIVVGAGPSLEKEIEQIKEIAPHALILAGGTAIGALLQNGITPHFGATCDPNHTQYLRLRQALPFAIPLFYRSRALYEALLYQQGPLFYLRGGDGYPIVEWFENMLGIQGPTVDGGNSVSNMLIEIAHMLGCGPIIMVGYDLAYTNEKAYPDAVSESLLPGESSNFSGKTRGNLLTIENSLGAPVQTETKWIIEGEWISKFQEEFPEKTIINTCNQGLPIENVSQMSFKQACDIYCDQTLNVDSLTHLNIAQTGSIQCPNEDIALAIKTICSSLQTAKELLEKIEELLHNDHDLHSVHLVNLQHELEGETAFEHVLLPFSKMHEKLSFMRKLIECRDRTSEESFEKDAFLKRCQLLKEACNAHLRFFFSCSSWAFLNGEHLPDVLDARQKADHSQTPLCLRN